MSEIVPSISLSQDQSKTIQSTTPLPFQINGHPRRTRRFRHQKKILTEHTVDTSKNFSNASSAILAKIPPNNSRLTYAAEDYLFHYVKPHDVVFMCMSEESLGRKIPFTFLNDLQNKFFNQFSQSDLASTAPYGLASSITELVTLPTGHNPQAADLNQPQQASSSNHQINLVRLELASVKGIMIKNVGEILNKGERIKLLLNKTDNLSAFRKRSPLATQVVVGRR
ncbi:hypothetical protein PGT21_009966 [Puccinia graminis f. sp. tritici]|uniref:Longin domain-containing protein n=1 Tax=Puccinia graminis f. sp. tritici TaxID=56615 RepID=A0A5B0NV47_PUCGR|nr:hypothetical protein PGT21_009966 [Puccinia graminis f. sp. tritici]